MLIEYKPQPLRTPGRDREHWHTLGILALPTLLSAIDASIVYILLPSVRTDFGFSDTLLIWVINAQYFTYAVFLLISGRLTDLFGPRRVFLSGIALFTVGSLGCGTARHPGLFLLSRAVQGLGGALISPASLTFALREFVSDGARVRAMSVLASVTVLGECAAFLLGGLLTSFLNWRWIFLVNLPLGVAAFVAGHKFLSRCIENSGQPKLDIAGAMMVSGSMLLSLYALSDGVDHRFASSKMYLLICGAMSLLIAFVLVESHSPAPLIPPKIFLNRSFVGANVVGVLLNAAMFSWGLTSTLYMQLVLKYSPLTVGLAYLPTSVIAALVSLSLSAKIIGRFGIRAPLMLGLVLVSAALALLARVPENASMIFDVLPSMFLIGLGFGMASPPLQLATFCGVRPEDRGVASGIATTLSMFGGLFGLSILFGAATRRADQLRTAGATVASALDAGYQEALLVAASLVILAVWVSGRLIPSESNRAARPEIGI